MQLFQVRLYQRHETRPVNAQSTWNETLHSAGENYLVRFLIYGLKPNSIKYGGRGEYFHITDKISDITAVKLKGKDYAQTHTHIYQHNVFPACETMKRIKYI